MRLDQALVEAHLFESRSKAKQAILDGLVFQQDRCLKKPSEQIEDPASLSIHGTPMPYVSRGGLKLEKALDTFQISLKNKIVLDIGSSTGGFTDCALQRGAQKVIAVDVGQEQLALSLRKNPKIILYEKTDFRSIDKTKISSCEIAVSDVSFISITKMIPKLLELPNLTDLICLIKPQFECGKEIADKYKGIIKDKKVHEELLNNIIDTFDKNGFCLCNLTFSPITGNSGNIEYLAHFNKKMPAKHIAIPTLITSAFSFFK